MKILRVRIEVIVRYFFLIFYIFTSILSASCAPISRISGYVPPQTETSQLKIGSSTKAEIIKKLGEPLNNSYSPNNFLLYVQKKVEIVAFLRPRIEDRKIVKLTFDTSSILSRIDFYDTVANQPFEADQKIIVSDGRRLTFWQQMFGNIGNFSSERFFE